jgi:hypothetical protein
LALGGAAALSGPHVFAQGTRIAKIGLVQSTTGGSAALYGVEQKQAIELAFSEINAANSLNNITLESIHADDGADRGQTVNIFQRPVAQVTGPLLWVTGGRDDESARRQNACRTNIGAARPPQEDGLVICTNATLLAALGDLLCERPRELLLDDRQP